MKFCKSLFVSHLQEELQKREIIPQVLSERLARIIHEGQAPEGPADRAGYVGSPRRVPYPPSANRLARSVR